ncbi:acyltransferase family protein [Mycolicibacterium sp. CBMA 226]|uniref:acyltransferase family protein n=1 Tax=Mycolicibacterium sp. CBMA 226 TaxID=2606611 RepID=UPI0012DC026D|nr:acyltransferase family protein [Mycolicibacterium sp. CBMA 226]MUL76168.1 acyltransferase [Mycolicibacterium sp. CBMA 226]
MSLSARYRRKARKRRREAERKHLRLDIQGLRMVAVLSVFANHLWQWPSGGFVGVDVFFVISGFLITGNLLRSAEAAGRVSFRQFYWNRVRRIVPAATVVLLLTYLASTLVFLPFRSHQIGIDALWAAIFCANWHFLSIGTNYFQAAAATVSPIQHYWSLSIEEQFYFVWPALILIISFAIIRNNWSPSRRSTVAGAVMAAIVATSLMWALWETAESPLSAYFNTFARIWELGIGALLATAVGLLAQVPLKVRPILSWAGLLLIGVSLVFIRDDMPGFPAPWALLPVVGAALVIVAGVGQEPEYQAFLRSPAAGYIGDISYSLYLIHWPVIVLLGAVMDVNNSFYVTAVALSFGLSIASYHLVENPLRRANPDKARAFVTAIRKQKYSPAKSTQYASLAAATLLAVAGVAWLAQPPPPARAHNFSDAASDTSRDGSDLVNVALPAMSLGPVGTALQSEVTEALKATEWPVLDPPMESLFVGGEENHAITPEVAKCTGSKIAPPEFCNYGSTSAPVKFVVVGDSVGSGYAEIFRELALKSNGRLQVINETMQTCAFTQDALARISVLPDCPGRKDSAVDVINSVKPDAVIISNSYLEDRIVGASQDMTNQEWSDSLNRIIGRFKDSTKKIVLLAPPAGHLSIKDCFSKVSSKPASCVTRIQPIWYSRAESEQKLAMSLGGVWVDSRPWFCSQSQRCPSFVGTTPARVDATHMAPPYASKIAPAVAESLAAAGIPLA